MNPKRDELATCELSIEELDAVAAGSIFGDAWKWIKGEVNGKVNEYKTAGHMMLDAGRTIIRYFF
jgi:hypothetical protein